jgi:hypothetical protein
MPHLIQILLPLYDNEQRAFPREYFAQVSELLTERFGGLTTYSRAPAEGLWKENARRTHRDDIVVYEVMAPELDRAWWQRFRRKLERLFRQQSLIIRAQTLELL